MAQPMLTITFDSTKDKKATPHLLPCRIHHDGPVEPTQSFWEPSTAQAADGTKTAYFRGRKLLGRAIPLPEGYRGVVAERRLPEAKDTPAGDEREPIDLEAEAEAGGQQGEVGNMESVAQFDEVVVWGHEVAAEPSEDPYVRGVEEWLDLSDRIHTYSAGKEK